MVEIKLKSQHLKKKSNSKWYKKTNQVLLIFVHIHPSKTETKSGVAELLYVFFPKVTLNGCGLLER